MGAGPGGRRMSGEKESGGAGQGLAAGAVATDADKREEYLEGLLASLTNAFVCVQDRDGRILEFFGTVDGPRYEKTRADVLLRPPREWLRAEDLDPALAVLREVFDTGQPGGLERSYELGQGRIWFDVRFP